MTQITIGSELECGAIDAAGKPIDVLAAVNGGLSTGNPFEEVTGDMSLYSMELVTGIADSRRALETSFDRLLALVPRGITLLYESQPFGSPVPLANKSRVAAVSAALAREHPRKGEKGVGQVAPWNATQFHLGVKGRTFRSPEGMCFRDFLEGCGPHARIRTNVAFGLRGWKHHQRCWYGFSHCSRVPDQRRFGTPEELDRYLGTIPKLVTKRGSDWIMAAPGLMSSLEDPESMGTIWWAARPRIWPDGSETVEWRVFESMPPSQASQLGAMVLALAHDFWSYVDDHPEADWTQDVWRDRVHAHCAQWHPLLVPERPLTRTEWLRMICL